MPQIAQMFSRSKRKPQFTFGLLLSMGASLSMNAMASEVDDVIVNRSTIQQVRIAESVFLDEQEYIEIPAYKKNTKKAVAHDWDDDEFNFQASEPQKPAAKKDVSQKDSPQKNAGQKNSKTQQKPSSIASGTFDEFDEDNQQDSSKKYLRYQSVDNANSKRKLDFQVSFDDEEYEFEDVAEQKPELALNKVDPAQENFVVTSQPASSKVISAAKAEQLNASKVIAMKPNEESAVTWNDEDDEDFEIFEFGSRKEQEFKVAAINFDKSQFPNQPDNNILHNAAVLNNKQGSDQERPLDGWNVEDSKPEPEIASLTETELKPEPQLSLEPQLDLEEENNSKENPQDQSELIPVNVNANSKKRPAALEAWLEDLDEDDFNFFPRRLPSIANLRNIVNDVPEPLEPLAEDSKVSEPDILDFADKKMVFKDRWRLVDKLGYHEKWYDPYNRNLLKADRPIWGEWFFNITGISDTTFEKRHLPTPVGFSTTSRPGSINVFGKTSQHTFLTNLAMEYVLYKGDTVFRPPDYEFRFLPVINYNATEVDEVGAVNVNPEEGKTRYKADVGVQGLFFDKHLRNVSDRYDFDSLRIGIQPYTHDFRGFLFLDNPFGVRLFGTRENNIYQYNLGWFRRLDKDINSGLNDLGEGLRSEDIYVANLYAQDTFYKGFNTQASIAHVRNRETSIRYDENDFIQRPASIGQERPREYDVTYLGLQGDGHIDRLNASLSAYYAFGEARNDTFLEEQTKIRAHFVAGELSRDMDWFRPKISFLHASGDKDPYDNTAEGFDAILESPQFAGADTSFWVRQSVPLVAGGQVGLSTRNGILNSLRSSREQGQANFTNPGMNLIGVGFDADVTPQTRISAQINKMYFDDTKVLEVARNQGSIDKEIGTDISINAIYRPLATQNIILRLAYARLLAGEGYKDLFPDEDPDSFFLNFILTY